MKKALPLAVFALSAVWLAITGNFGGDFRIDEAHKISETYFLRLIERGDFRGPDWQSSPIERANPPVGKVLFGLAMQIARVPLPADMTFAAHPDPRGKPAQFRPALLPTRIVSLLATAGTSALLCLLAGPIASVLFIGSFLVHTYGTSAVFDPLLTFFLVAAAVPVALRVTWPRTVAAAVLAALAFDTRASGILAIMGVLTLLIVHRRFGQAAAAIAIFFAVATALNPLYWSAGGYVTQFRDLNAVLAATGEHRLGPLEKIEFVSEYLFGDLIGFLTLLGLPFAIRRPPAPILWWCLAVAVAFTAWIPVGYPRYVLTVLPAFAIAASFGYRQLVVIGGHFVERRRRKA